MSKAADDLADALMWNKNGESRVFIAAPPPPATWRVQVGGLSINVHEAPNRFHRWMQKLIFGLRWTKL